MQGKIDLLPEYFMDNTLNYEKPTTLSQQVASYQLKRLTKLATIALGIFGSIMLLITVFHISLMRTHSQLEQTHRALLTTHKRHAQTWRIRATKAKKLKLLKSQTLGNSQAPLLKEIATIIPTKTLLTSFCAKKNTFILTGYASTTEELSEFMIGLSTIGFTLGFTKISLPISRKEPSGIYFVINSCR